MNYLVTKRENETG